MSSVSYADDIRQPCNISGMVESGGTLASRLKSAREMRGVSQEAVGAAEGVGVSRAAVAQWEREKGEGGTAPTADKIQGICEFLDIDPVWLLAGQVGKWSKGSKEIGVATIAVPEYDVRVSAGGGFVVNEETKRDVWPFSRRYLVDELRLSPAQLCIVEVVGDSMEPTLRPGDRVMVNMADKRVSQPGLFVLWDGDGTVVKRLELIPNSKPQRLNRISDNSLHQSYVVVASETIIVGRVVWFARRA